MPESTSDVSLSHAVHKGIIFADFPRLDVERVCRVLIRIATHLEETDHEELSTQEEGQQQQRAINGMDTRRVEHR